MFGDEVCAEISLQIGDLAADAWQRRIQLPAARRQAPGVNHRKQNPHSIKPIHNVPTIGSLDVEDMKNRFC